MTLCVYVCVVLQLQLSEQWLGTCHQAFAKSGYMYEKYNAYVVGQGGGGGEYKPQIGFGWTNGVALVLLEQVYGGGEEDEEEEGILKEMPWWAVLILVIGIGAVIGLALLLRLKYKQLEKKRRGPLLSETEMDEDPLVKKLGEGERLI